MSAMKAVLLVGLLLFTSTIAADSLAAEPANKAAESGTDIIEEEQPEDRMLADR